MAACGVLVDGQLSKPRVEARSEGSKRLTTWQDSSHQGRGSDASGVLQDTPLRKAP